MNPYYFSYLKRMVDDYRVCARCTLSDRHGELLCKANAVISTSAWMEITKTMHPSQVLSSISLIGEYNSLTLEADFLSVLQSDPSFAEFYDAKNHQTLLVRNLRFLCKHPELTQHLTLLNIYLPEAFARAVFCAWFATLIYIDNAAKDEDVKNIFLAAMCHDLGLLHIDPALLLDPPNRRRNEYYTHVEVGANLVNELPGTSRDVVRAIMEHHEHLDSSGQPRGLGSNQLGYAGQYIHLLDNLYELYIEQFKGKGKSLCDTIPIVEMNSISHFGHTAKSTIKVLERGSRTEGTLIPPDILKPLVDDIKARYAYIVFANDIIQEFTNTVGFRHDDRALFMLQNSMIHVALTLDKSQLLNPAYMRWLDHVVEYDIKREHHLIELSFLMSNEVLYHIEKFRNQLFVYQQFCKLRAVQPHVEYALQRFSSKPLPHK